MFIGHFAVGFGAKKVAPKTNLATLFIAAQFLDLLWPTLLLLGIETVKINPGITKVNPLEFTSYPYSHSLLMVGIWAILLGAIYWIYSKSIKYAVVIGLCVLSHWVLDLFVHIPDLPLYPGESPMFGMGIWNSVLFTILIEGIIFSTGIYLYIKSTKPLNKTGTYSLAGLILFFLVVYFMNFFSSPPPTTEAIGWAGQLQWIFVLWAFWVDKNRAVLKN